MTHEESKLFVGGLPPATTHAELVRLFATVGPVFGVKVVMDRQTKLSKGFAFVEMATPADAQAALKKLDGHKLGDRRIFVTPARPLEKRDAPAAPAKPAFVERRSGKDRRAQASPGAARRQADAAPPAKAPKPAVKPSVFGPGFTRDKWKKPNRQRP
ncbi:MAG TPA: RNA-binding protein [Elusimicrobiota bacterium]|nr:RNA-binding protein [Elusimicrobiota bacterium]